jgi:protein gp37
MADVFEDRRDLDVWRERLWDLIEQTPWCDWQLLTKRPECIERLIRPAWLIAPRPNVWLGTTVENQEYANRRIPILLRIPAAIRWLSIEPQIGRVSLLETWETMSSAARRFHHHWSGRPGTADTTMMRGLHWAIVGGESGGRHTVREFHLEWARLLLTECRMIGVAPFIKQMGSSAWDTNGERLSQISFVQRKGDDPKEWPKDLQIREFPSNYNPREASS